MEVTDKIRITNEDCMELLKRTPDKYYDLCISDPPYGIGEDGRKGVRTSPSRPNSYLREPKYKAKGWGFDLSGMANFAISTGTRQDR